MRPRKLSCQKNHALATRRRRQSVPVPLSAGDRVTVAAIQGSRACGLSVRGIGPSWGVARSDKSSRELIEAMTNDLGGAEALSEAQRQMITQAAVLGALIENNAALWMAGQPVDLAQHNATINTQRRLLATLGLERRAHDVSPPTLRERLMREDDDR
jgi:hypothetical protein